MLLSGSRVLGAKDKGKETGRHAGGTGGNDRREDSVDWHGRGPWADAIRPHKLWFSLWMARGAPLRPSEERNDRV